MNIEVIELGKINIKEPVFMPEDEVPMRITTRSEEWIEFLEKIPTGQALVTTRKELGVTASSLKSTINRLIKNGRIPSNYYVRTHKTSDDTAQIYIINSVRSQQKRKRSTPKS